MNSKNVLKLIIILSCFSLLAASLFPPYIWMGDNYVSGKSYEFIFSNNVVRDGSKYVFSDDPQASLPTHRVLIIQELLIEYFLIITFWGTVFFLFFKSSKANNA